MNRLKELRSQKKLTQKDLGALLNVKSMTISNFETGRTPLTDVFIIKAAQLFNVSSDYLLGSSFTRTNIEIDLSEDEKKILFYYNRLDEENKDLVKGLMIDLFREKQNVFEELYKKRAA